MLTVDDPHKNLGPLGEWAIRHFRWSLVLLVALTALLLVWSFVFAPSKSGAFGGMTVWAFTACFFTFRVGKIRALRDGRPPRAPDT